MNKNLDNKQIDYIKKFLNERLDNIEQALEDNMIFYEEDLIVAFAELEMINSILKGGFYYENKYNSISN